MRGAPQVGFSAAMRKIKARISLLTAFRPLMGPVLESHFQYNRKPARCHSTTVLGVTRSRGFCHSAQSFLHISQNSFCMADSGRRGRLACRANSCCRRARFSRMRSSRDLKTLTTQPKRCRSHTIIAKNLTGFQQVEVSAKSLILGMRVVLTRTMRSVGKRTSLQGPISANLRIISGLLVTRPQSVFIHIQAYCATGLPQRWQPAFLRGFEKVGLAKPGNGLGLALRIMIATGAVTSSLRTTRCRICLP